MGMLKKAQAEEPANGPVKGPPDAPPSGGPPDQQPNATPDGQPDAGDGAPDSGDPGDPGDKGDSGGGDKGDSGGGDPGADVDTPETDPSEEGGTGKPPAAKGKGDGVNAEETAAEKKFSPEQMAEFHQALKLMYMILYKNDQTSAAVVNMIQPQDKIGSIGKATVLVLHQIDKKLQLKDSAVKLAITITAVDRLVELAQKAKGIQFSKDEAAHLLAAAVHGANTLFHGPQPHPAGPQGPGGPPQGGPPGAAPPQGGPPPGGPPGGAPPPGPQGPPSGPAGALAQGAAAQAKAQSSQGMPPPPPPVPGGAPQGQPPPGGK